MQGGRQPVSCTRCSLGAPWPIHPPVTAVGLVREESRELCTPWEDGPGPGPGPACPSCNAGLPTRSLGSALVLHKGLGESCPPLRGWLSVFGRQLPNSFQRPLGFVAGLAIRPRGHFPTPRRKQSLTLTLKGPVGSAGRRAVATAQCPGHTVQASYPLPLLPPPPLQSQTHTFNFPPDSSTGWSQES